MSKKVEVEGQNAPQPTIEGMLQGDKTLTDKASVVSGMFFNGTTTPPVVYVQGNDRVIVVAATADALPELCETVTAILSGNGISFFESGVYGNETTTGKVWKVISINS